MTLAYIIKPIDFIQFFSDSSLILIGYYCLDSSTVTNEFGLRIFDLHSFHNLAQ